MKQTIAWPIYDKTLYENKWKDNKGYAAIILNAVRIICTTEPIELESLKTNWIQHLKIQKSKLSRLFVYVGQNKYFSCYFPFIINRKGDKSKVYMKDIEITEKLLSESFSLLYAVRESYFYNKYTEEDEESSYSVEAYKVIEELITAEPCYIRYDYDTIGEKSHVHPLIHFDINMSKAGTFKVGLSNPLSTISFENLFDKSVDCLYLVEHDRIEKVSNLRRYSFCKKKRKRK